MSDVEAQSPCPTPTLDYRSPSHDLAHDRISDCALAVGALLLAMTPTLLGLRACYQLARHQPSPAFVAGMPYTVLTYASAPVLLLAAGYGVASAAGWRRRGVPLALALAAFALSAGTIVSGAIWELTSLELPDIPESLWSTSTSTQRVCAIVDVVGQLYGS